MSESAKLPEPMGESSVEEYFSKVKENDLVIVYWLDSGAHSFDGELELFIVITVGLFRRIENQTLTMIGSRYKNSIGDEKDTDVSCIWTPSIIDVWAVSGDQPWLKHIQSGGGNNE